MEYVHLDSGSEWAASTAADILLREGKLAEARESIQSTSIAAAKLDRDLLLACLNMSQSSTLGRIAQKAEATVLRATDPEAHYFVGSVLAYCGQTDAAIRLLKSAIGQNYCAYTALETDPLFLKLRGSTEFNGLLSAAKACQNRILAQQHQSLP
jgi:hypothetical protein